jgi:hypothetical protein
MRNRVLWILVAALWSPTIAAAPGFTPADRVNAIRRAQVWTATDVAQFDFKVGGGEFGPWSTVACDHVVKKYNGNTPKFGCGLAPDEVVKVKYGAENSEVYVGVAATRLLRALGFGADELYPVHVDCRGCPADLNGTAGGPGVSHFEVAAIERKLKGKDVVVNKQEGWKWAELDLVDPAAGGAPLAHRDALKLMAVFLQHTDNKSEQQRLLCLPAPSPSTLPAAAATPAPAPITAPATTSTATSGQAAAAPSCEKPFMLVHDLGNTFGKANKFNRASVSGGHLANWSSVPVWKDAAQCVGDLSKSFTGNLSNPRISEEGRKFLADLLVQLSDAQLTDLFTVAHFAGGPARMRAAGTPEDTIALWVKVFKQKRDEIVQAKCPS